MFVYKEKQIACILVIFEELCEQENLDVGLFYLPKVLKYFLK